MSRKYRNMQAMKTTLEIPDMIFRRAKSKAVGFLIRQVHHHLESMRRLRLSLKVGERGRKAGFFNLDFHQEPGLAVTNHQEVHLPLLFVAQVTQLEIAKSQVRPPVYGLEQMAGDHGLRPRAVVGQSAP